jgi:hypothetical protein
VGPSGRTPQEPLKGPLKNKPENRGVFFGPQNMTAKTPLSPRKTPQLHHQNTTSKTPFFLKHPQKTPIKRRKIPDHQPGIFFTIFL